MSRRTFKTGIWAMIEEGFQEGRQEDTNNDGDGDGQEDQTERIPVRLQRPDISCGANPFTRSQPRSALPLLGMSTVLLTQTREPSGF
jgi:hypothetical protein